jgi:SAM-dependent methyltransferase
MEKAIEILVQSITDKELINCTFSGPRDKSELRNVLIQVLNSNEFKIEYRLTKHNDIKTMGIEELESEITGFFNDFKQCMIKNKSSEVQILLNKKRKSKIITKNAENKVKAPGNRIKNYLIPDGEKCDFLIAIGVMSPNGKVKQNYYNKFKQINRFLEMVDDLYKDISSKQALHAVDFGCGKSYLTFALYHYFKNIKNVDIEITGIDLKQEVIDHCNEIAKKIGFEQLKFAHGFIHNFKTDKKIDFVVTLHACDTATDDAILFSLENHADKMMFVPCCQHELNKQLKNHPSQILLKHGIFKDRMTEIVTDTMRSQLLEACGYKVQSMEFIDLAHTAKNVLLRCTKVDRDNKTKTLAYKKYLDFKEQWNITPYLEKQLLELDYLTDTKS